MEVNNMKLLPRLYYEKSTGNYILEQTIQVGLKNYLTIQKNLI